MPDTIVPVDDDTGDPLKETPVHVAAVAHVTRTSPIKVSGPTGSRHTGIRIGETSTLLLLAGAGDTRLTELMHLEVFLVKALAHIRVALRDEADHVEAQAEKARRVEITDRDDQSSVRAAS